MIIKYLQLASPTSANEFKTIKVNSSPWCYASHDDHVPQNSSNALVTLWKNFSSTHPANKTLQFVQPILDGGTPPQSVFFQKLLVHDSGLVVWTKIT